MILTLALPAPAEVDRKAPDPEPAREHVAARGARSAASLMGYDFETVVKQWEKSVAPLQNELDSSFKVFTETVEAAGTLLKEGRTEQAIERMNQAVRGVLVVRDQVMTPMWDGQKFLNIQIGKVRERLARAVPPGKEQVKIDSATEQTLNGIAKEIMAEGDAVRRKRLTVRYKAIRALAEIKSLAARLTPDQRRLWLNVLRVLEEASLTHMQLLMRAELMFAQLDATATHLDDYNVLYHTLTGAIDLMKQVRRGDARSAIRRMSDFSLTVKGLSGNIEGAVETLMQQLDRDLANIQDEIDDDYADVFGQTETDLDTELNARIDRLRR
ncbi:MAG: hypothetical protein CMJ18_27540 [Phycisphaeraceae bacterium]|nr:hypothetical protein [Phycisphaeraceae bacterium]